MSRGTGSVFVSGNAGTGVVDVIVPVYGGDEETRRCLASLMTARCRTMFEIVVVDDCSPSAGLSAWLDEAAASGRLTLLRNDTNRGFVASVNRGMALHGDRDVVLLNSDAEVANDWLDRLLRCAQVAPDVGTVTPFSNNATVCSYPYEGWTGEVPGTLGLAGLDALFARTLPETVVDLPSAVGFCMLIRRACLDAVGMFDEDVFGLGYGEENDFSRRAVAAGWRNVLAADVFVYHRGGVSFGEGRTELMRRNAEILLARHPDYEDVVSAFIARDPLAPLRRRINEARAALGGSEFAAVMTERRAELEFRRMTDRPLREALPVQLHVTHKWGGGIERWVQDFCAADLSRRNLILRGRTSRNETSFQIELVDPQLGPAPLRTWDLSEPITGVATHHDEYREILDWVCRAFDVRAVLVSSLIGHSLDVFDSELPTVVIAHDLFPFCPALFACFGQPCSDCGRAELENCLDANPHNIFWHVTDADRWMRVREVFAEKLINARPLLASPTQDVRRRYEGLFPAVTALSWVEIAHGLGGALCRAGSLPQVGVGAVQGRLRVLVPGRMLPHKGMWLLQAVIGELTQFADVTLLGSGDFGQPFEGMPGVEVVREYDIDALPALVEAVQPDCALLLSVLPESFSYTLSEMTALRIPVLATRMGAFAERIEDGETGFLVSADARSVIDRLRALDADRCVLEHVTAELHRQPVRTAFDMVKAYHDLLPEVDGVPSGRSAEGLLELLFKGVQLAADLADERAASARFEADVHAHSALVRNREARIAELEAEAAGLTRRVHDLNLDLVRARLEHDALLASSSWRLTRPLRAISGLLSGTSSASASETAPLDDAQAGATAQPEPDMADREGGADSRQAVAFAGPADKVVPIDHAKDAPLARSVAGCRRLVRERLGLPDGAFVVAGSGGKGAFEHFVRVAGAVTQHDTHAAFVWLGACAEVDSACKLEADLLVETRDLFLPVTFDPNDWVAGMDVYLDFAEEVDPNRLIAQRAGVRLLTFDSLGGDPGMVSAAFRIDRYHRAAHD